jgi:cytochrome c oxidase subunit 3
VQFPGRRDGAKVIKRNPRGYTMGQQHDAYFVPAKSQWPIVAAVVMFITVLGAAHWLNAEPGEAGFGKSVLTIGVIGVLGMFFGWFRSVINESLAGSYNRQVDTSFRMGMMWFIFSEVMFFGAFFGALFYVRHFAGPWLGGEGGKGSCGATTWRPGAPTAATARSRPAAPSAPCLRGGCRC